MMELSPRKQNVLKAVVETYIDSGEPISSKALCAILGTSLSSATLRNELSELCEMGYLFQPHTSAGRIPTNSAYRLYIETMLMPNSPPVRVREELDGLLDEASKDPMRICDAAAKLLSDFTGLPTLLATAGGGGEYVKYLEAIPMGRHAAMLILVSSAGTAECRFCRLPNDRDSETFAAFNRVAEERVVGKKLADVTMPFLRNIAVSSGNFAVGLTPLLIGLAEISSEIARPKVSFGGNAYPLSVRKSELMQLLNGIEDEVGVVFGEATGISDLSLSNVVVARYGARGNKTGRIGVIGPKRMAYRQMMPNLRYFAARLGELLEQNRFDMEE